MQLRFGKTPRFSSPQGSAAARNRRLRPAYLTRFCAILWLLPAGAHAQPAAVGYRVEADAEGAESVVLEDSRGEVTGHVSLEHHVARFGSGDAFALVSRDRSGPESQVEIRDGAGGLISQFSIPSDRSLALGSQTVALSPSQDHALGSAFDIEFRGLDGQLLAAHTRPGRVLVSLQGDVNDHWIAISVAGNEREVVHFGPRGQFLWSFMSPASALPVVALSLAGDRAAIGVIADDLRSSHLYLLNAAGAVVDERDLLQFRSARFSPDGQLLLLAGSAGLQLLRADDGSTLWSEKEDLDLAPGNSVAFSRDAARFFVVTQERRPSGVPERVSLRSYSSLGAAPQRSERVLGELPSDRRISVREFGVQPDGRLKLMTRDRTWLLPQEGTREEGQ